MASFESGRFCKITEYKYFEQEKREIATLSAGELCVAMSLLEANEQRHEAVALPVLVRGSIEDILYWNGYDTNKKLIDDLFRFKILDTDHIDASGINIVPHNIGMRVGYIRDHIEGLDGTFPEAEVSELLPISALDIETRQPIYA